MRTIIAGTRNINSYQQVCNAISAAELYGISCKHIITGGCRGVDTLGINYAKNNNIEFTIYNADWNLYGKSAGPIRNEIMSRNADALIAIWDGKSKGTADMIKKAENENLIIYIHKIK